MGKNRISKPSDKSDGLFFTKPEGFRMFKDVPASLMEHRGGLDFSRWRAFQRLLDALDAREREKVFAIFGQISCLRRARSLFPKTDLKADSSTLRKSQGRPRSGQAAPHSLKLPPAHFVLRRTGRRAPTRSGRASES